MSFPLLALFVQLSFVTLALLAELFVTLLFCYVSFVLGLRWLGFVALALLT